VLHDSGLCEDSTVAPVRRASQKTASTRPPQQQADAGAEAAEAETFEQVACRDLANWAGAPEEMGRHVLLLPSRFYSKLEKAMGLAMAHLEPSKSVLRGRDDDQGSGSWPMALQQHPY
jgi:hypothetical protein